MRNRALSLCLLFLGALFLAAAAATAQPEAAPVEEAAPSAEDQSPPDVPESPLPEPSGEPNLAGNTAANPPAGEVEEIDPNPNETQTPKEVPERTPDPGIAEVNRILADRTSAAEAADSEEDAANAPPGGAYDRSIPHYMRWLAGLFMVCGAIIFLGYLARRFGQRTPLLAGQRFGSVIGRIFLTPRASLHYVKTGDRILVVGVTQQSVNLVSEFSADAFEELAPASSGASAGLESNDFLAQLRAETREPLPLEADSDDEMAALRGDIQRLQQFLRQSSSEPHA